MITLDIICNPDIFQNFRPSFRNAVSKITGMNVVIDTSMTGFQTGWQESDCLSSYCTVVLQTDGSEEEKTVLDMFS
jgi:hypothetical protein